jgi:transposase
MCYPTDLTDEQWNAIRLLVPEPKPGGRPAKYPRWETVNAVPYQARNGAVWRGLPHDLPPYRVVFHDFRRWQRDGTWERIHDRLRTRVRQRDGRTPEPTAAILDSQSVKTTEQAAGAISRNPASGELIATYPFQPPEEVDRTLAAGVGASQRRRATPMAERIGRYRRLAAKLPERSEAIALLVFGSGFILAAAASARLRAGSPTSGPRASRTWKPVGKWLPIRSFASPQ